jgi:hypothetical protein
MPRPRILSYPIPICILFVSYLYLIVSYCISTWTSLPTYCLVLIWYWSRLQPILFSLVISSFLCFPFPSLLHKIILVPSLIHFHFLSHSISHSVHAVLFIHLVPSVIVVPPVIGFLFCHLLHDLVTIMLRLCLSHHVLFHLTTHPCSVVVVSQYWSTVLLWCVRF